MRNALKLLDLQDPSAASLKRFILACVIHPLFLRNSLGRKFLVYLFSLHLPLVREMHHAIKSQVRSCFARCLLPYSA
jgi:hypothetical protein